MAIAFDTPELLLRRDDAESGPSANHGRTLPTLDVSLSPYGAWTLRKAPKQAGLEPDECYLIGDQARDTPDLAIEVVWTSGGIDKLEIYRRLGVREVWRWQDSRIEVHVLRERRYEISERSTLFPDLDVQLLGSFLDHPTALQAVKAFREALRA